MRLSNKLEAASGQNQQHRRPDNHPRAEVLIALAGAGLSALAAGITASGSTADHAWLEATARASMVSVPIAVGLYAWRHPASERFGALLMVTGILWFLTTLSEASDPTLYSIGRLAGWVVEPVLLYLVLAFPTGHLRSRFDATLVWGLLALILVLYLPTAFLVDRYPEPAPWTTCTGGCPANAFMLAGSEPAVIEDLVRPLREVLTILLFAAASVRLAARLLDSTPLMRRTLAPVLVVAALRLASFSALIVARRIDADSTFVGGSLWSLSLAVPVLALAFLVGLARWRMFIAVGMARLATRLAGHPQPADLREALAEAFDDPTIEILYWRESDGTWIDTQGAEVAPPAEHSGRCLTEVRDGEHRIAAIVHDEALRHERAFIDAATAYALITIDNHRLGVETAVLLGEVRESRARIQSSADDERRRIERDLHDGAQQRLVALRIKLELAAERVSSTDPHSADLIRDLGTEVDRTLDEVRSLARGIYPSPLSDRGLVEGLRSAAMQAALPTTVLASGVRKRYPRPIESAAYFCCLEALQNAVKHAAGASAVVINLIDQAGVLRFDVQDDGAGFDVEAADAGIGLTSMDDRLAAVGGDLSIVSSPNRGTHVVGRIPLGKTSQNGADPAQVRRARR